MKAILETLRPYSKVVKEFDDIEKARDYINASDMSLGMFVSVVWGRNKEVYTYRNGKYLYQYTTAV